MAPTEISSSLHMHTLLASTPFVIADFYATWCPPCKTIAPLYTQLADAHGVQGKFAFVKVNVDEQREVAAKWGVTAMPTFIVFEGGKKVEEVRGADVAGLRRVVKGVAGKVGGLVEREKQEKEKEKRQGEGKKEEEGVKVGDESTVSGSYGMTRGEGWKMSLR